MAVGICGLVQWLKLPISYSYGTQFTSLEQGTKGEGGVLEVRCLLQRRGD